MIEKGKAQKEFWMRRETVVVKMIKIQRPEKENAVKKEKKKRNQNTSG